MKQRRLLYLILLALLIVPIPMGFFFKAARQEQLNHALIAAS